MNTFLFRFLICAGALALAACGSAPVVRETAAGVPLPAPDARSTNATINYRIGGLDVLDISVFGVADLTRTVRVSADGDISLPLIGRIHAGGHTTQELEESIGDELSKSYLQNPQVSVFVKEFASQRITVEGSVGKPGIYSLSGDTTLLQAVALAGGLTRLAQEDGIVVFRQIQGKRMAAVFDIDKISKGNAIDPLIYAGDIVVVQQSGSKNALDNFIRAAPAIGLFLLY